MVIYNIVIIKQNFEKTRLYALQCVLVGRMFACVIIDDTLEWKILFVSNKVYAISQIQFWLVLI